MALYNSFNHSLFPFGQMVSPFSRFGRFFDDDDLGFFGDRHHGRSIFDFDSDFHHDLPFFSDKLMNDSTHQQAKKLLEEATKNHELKIHAHDKPEELIKEGGSELEDFYRRFGQNNKNGKVAAVSYHTSSITKDGKTVTVSKESRLSPKGKVVTRVNERIEDAEGHRDSKTWWKKDNLRTKYLTNDLHHSQPTLDHIESTKRLENGDNKEGNHSNRSSKQWSTRGSSNLSRTSSNNEENAQPELKRSGSAAQ